MSATTDVQHSEGASSRRGFALPLAILALALITAAVAASSAATRAEIVANQAVRAQDKAYQMAEAGLQLFMARRSEYTTGAFTCTGCVASPGTAVIDSEYTRVSLVGGYADVAAIRVRPYINDTMPALFFVKSRGVDTTARMGGTGLTVYAERTVGQYASFNTAKIKPQGMFVSITGFTKSTTGSTISGVDECSYSYCSCSGSDTTINSVVVPTGEYSGSTLGLTPGYSASLSAATLMQRIGIDWNAIVNNNAIPASYTDAFPASAATWAVVHITSASYTLPRDGNGILIAEGDVILAGSRDWDGILLAGGRVISSGSQASSGLVISGLNYLLPGASAPPAGPGNNSSITNSKPFRYNSCNVAQAMALLTTYYAWSNTWLDNVAVW